MWETMLLTFGIFALCVLFMAVGYIFAGKTLKGSCGGLSNFLGLKCMICKNEECPTKNEQKS